MLSVPAPGLAPLRQGRCFFTVTATTSLLTLAHCMHLLHKLVAQHRCSLWLQGAGGLPGRQPAQIISPSPLFQSGRPANLRMCGARPSLSTPAPVWLCW